MKSKIQNRTIIADNLKAMLEYMSWSERDLARKSHVSQKTINNILNEETSPRVDTLDRVASAFNLKGWQLMLPGVPPETVLTKAMAEVVEYFSKATDEGREYIHRIAEKEATYIKK